jgi:predicted dehydrogenase
MNLSGVMQLPRLFKRAGVVESGRPIPYAQREAVLEECRHFLACVRDRLEPIGGEQVAVAVIRTLEALFESLHWGGRNVPV